MKHPWNTLPTPGVLCVLTRNLMGGQCNFSSVRGASVLNANLRGGYCNFLNIRGILCINMKPQGWSMYFTLKINATEFGWGVMTAGDPKACQGTKGNLHSKVSFVKPYIRIETSITWSQATSQGPRRMAGLVTYSLTQQSACSSTCRAAVYLVTR